MPRQRQVLCVLLGIAMSFGGLLVLQPAAWAVPARHPGAALPVAGGPWPTSGVPDMIPPAASAAYPSPVVPTAMPGAQTQGPNGWVVQVIARGLPSLAVGADVRLVLDAEGRPHLACIDRVRGGLWYAQDLGTDWRIEPIAPDADILAALVLGPAGQPHVVYCEMVCNGYTCFCGQQYYAHRDDDGWRREKLWAGYSWPSIVAVDAGGRPHMVYTEVHGAMQTQTRPFYAFYDGTSWITETLAETAQEFTLAFDAAGRLHMGWYDRQDGHVKHAVRESGGWQAEAVDGEVDFVSAISLALDAAGRPHLLYVESKDEGGTAARYAFRDGAGWHVVVLSMPGQFGLRGPAFSVDAAGYPHMAYHAAEGEDLLYAHYNGAQWQIEVVESPDALWDDIALALDAAGRPHIGYMGDYGLKYAWRTIAPVLPESGGPAAIIWLLLALALVGIGLAIRYGSPWRKVD